MRTQPLSERIRSLTPRQAEAVAWTWHGYTIEQIGAAMGCSYETARNHLHGGYVRLGIDHWGAEPAGCPRVLAAVALYRALELATKGDHTMAMGKCKSCKKMKAVNKQGYCAACAKGK